MFRELYGTLLFLQVKAVKWFTISVPTCAVVYFKESKGVRMVVKHELNFCSKLIQKLQPFNKKLLIRDSPANATK